MAIDFIKQKERQRYLVFAFFIVLVITAVVIYIGYFKQDTVTSIMPTTISIPPREIKIDFGLLDSSFLKDLELFNNIPQFAGTSGRLNPFLPY